MSPDPEFSEDFETEEPTWREKRYVPMAELVFGEAANDVEE